MKPRLNLFAKMNLLKPVLTLGQEVEAMGLEKSLMELVKMRASQLNGCAFCLNMHMQDALADGETPARLVLLDGWRESPLYSDRERAALAWTEALTRIGPHGASDEDWAALDAAFNDDEKIALTLVIGGINMWNRLNVGFRTVHPVGRAMPTGAAA